MIYTTNWIERLNKVIRKTEKVRNSFPLKDNPELKKVKVADRNKPLVTIHADYELAKYFMFKSSKYVFELTDNFLLVPQ
jgi:transposase-like protein